MAKITVVGMGPGDPGLITREVWDLMKNAAHLILRTSIHPTVEAIRAAGIVFNSYDDMYETAENFNVLYNKICDDLIERAGTGSDIVYAVPGSPLVAEKTVALLREKLADNPAVVLDIRPGMSFVEILYTQLNIDPIDGLTILDAGDVSKLSIDHPTGLVITQIYDKTIASDTKLSLMELFSDEYEVTFIHNLGLPDESVRKIPLYELDRQADIDHLTSLYVPSRPNAQNFDLAPLVAVMKTLREPGGCPWDREQTHESLRRNIIEEVYEVIEAIDKKDYHGLCEELGDLLMQIVFHARVAEEARLFTMQDVIDGITEKLVRRHPHVFGDISVADAAEVLVNWEEIKKREKPERISLLDGIPPGLPALITAEKLQHKAAKGGFDWDNIEPVWEKCREEWRELQEAAKEKDQEHILEEYGDVLFVLVNLARFLHIDPELSLMGANRKFRQRFLYVEQCVKSSGKEWADFSLAELDEFWREAKLKERN